MTHNINRNVRHLPSEVIDFILLSTSCVTFLYCDVLLRKVIYRQKKLLESVTDGLLGHGIVNGDFQ